MGAARARSAITPVFAVNGDGLGKSPVSPARHRSIAATGYDAQPLPKGRVRRGGGGRRSVCENDPGLVPALKRLVEPATLGDPMRPLIWVSKSMEKIAATLTQMGHPISADTVCTELVKLGFSRQSNRKADEGSKHPDRNAQFDYIRENHCGGRPSNRWNSTVTPSTPGRR